MFLPFFTGICIAARSPERMIAYKTFFAFTGLLLFLMAHNYFIANLPNRFKIMNSGFIASDYICKYLYFGNILSNILAILPLLLLTVSQQMRHPPGRNLPNIQDVFRM